MSTSVQKAQNQVRKLAPRMGLHGWTITVKPMDENGDDADLGSDATIDVNDTRDRATISLSPRADKWPPGKLRHVITHELVHVLFRDLDECTLASVSSGRTCSDLTRTREVLVERLACAIGGRRPPPW